KTETSLILQRPGSNAEPISNTQQAFKASAERLERRASGRIIQGTAAHIDSAGARLYLQWLDSDICGYLRRRRVSHAHLFLVRFLGPHRSPPVERRGLHPDCGNLFSSQDLA